MGVSFSVKNIPEELAQRLRIRAERNHRSLQGELMAILEAAASEDLPAITGASESRGTRRVEDSLQGWRTLFPVPSRSNVSSASLIRQMRNGRYGEDWAEGGEPKGAA
ncbi:MAG: Arc family DNA-binding protein [Propionivibrio sp.]|uniref:Arc family DNA-binding protein n=1 Tax=Candidatus Propionivibrio dominans TaxID=2954373 RepID=A0A9D7FB07_9RHOO|nr:Arc family DNA-binding protein [Candidatus Propionivibrio dominans]MBL0166653.1 Arc family DNA-binding protein [Propionivibrio sp.]